MRATMRALKSSGESWKDWRGPHSGLCLCDAGRVVGGEKVMGTEKAWRDDSLDYQCVSQKGKTAHSHQQTGSHLHGTALLLGTPKQFSVREGKINSGNSSPLVQTAKGSERAAKAMKTRPKQDLVEQSPLCGQNTCC